jgi:uncharacterized protein Yka (UPF0111/DUF47 family)
MRRWFLPYTPDLLKLLLAQSDVTVAGMEAFARWSAGETAEGETVRRAEHEADDARRKLMVELRTAFTTPLDPEDIYELSERLDEVINGAKNAVRESEVMEVPPNEALAVMAGHLRDGVAHLADAFTCLVSDRDRATEAADAAIHSERMLEHAYRAAMSELTGATDLRMIAGRRELLRRYARIGESLVRVAHRVWYLVVKES